MLCERARVPPTCTGAHRYIGDGAGGAKSKARLRAASRCVFLHQLTIQSFDSFSGGLPSSPVSAPLCGFPQSCYCRYFFTSPYALQHIGVGYTLPTPSHGVSPLSAAHGTVQRINFSTGRYQSGSSEPLRSFCRVYSRNLDFGSLSKPSGFPPMAWFSVLHQSSKSLPK